MLDLTFPIHHYCQLFTVNASYLQLLPAPTTPDYPYEPPTVPWTHLKPSMVNITTIPGGWVSGGRNNQLKAQLSSAELD